ncbi:MAG: ATP-binding cassette domain-containing protein, partial [Acidimicrobiales bacterium]
MLRASGVTKSYGEVAALKGVDLAVDSGQIVALLGRNGAGKTTLLSVIAGLLAADGGSVELDGVDAL